VVPELLICFFRDELLSICARRSLQFQDNEERHGSCGSRISARYCAGLTGQGNRLPHIRIKINPLGFVYQIVYAILIDKLVVAKRVLGQATFYGDVAMRLRITLSRVWRSGLTVKESRGNKQY
jgi:hypothetical protein